MMVLPTEPSVLAHEAPCLVTMLRILEREYEHLEEVKHQQSLIVNWTLHRLHTHCTLRGLDHAMSLVSFKPILRPLTAPNAAPEVKTKRQKGFNCQKKYHKCHISDGKHLDYSSCSTWPQVCERRNIKPIRD